MSDSEEERFERSRSQNKAKRGFGEEDSYYNDEFLKQFQSRFGNGSKDWFEEFQQDRNSKGGDYEELHKKGTDIKVELEISFFDSIKGVDKGLIFDRKVI